jgi:5-formyltetrahydrofolate cyclo-ligase
MRRMMLAGRRNGTGRAGADRTGPGRAGADETGTAAAVARRATETTALTRRLLALPEVAAAYCVALYVTLGGEPDTHDILAGLRARGIRVLLPAVRADLDLDFREYTGTLVPGARGTREPPPAAPAVDLARADVVIVPVVAVDRQGRRLGRGGGSYDRALARVRTGVPVVALAYDREVVDAVPTRPHDRRVTVIVTPTRAMRCDPM